MIRLFFFLTTLAFAQFKDVDKQELAFKNIIKNSGFENGITSWSKTGSATLTSSTSNPAQGKMKGVVDFSAAGEFLRTATTTIPEGLYGKNCYARFRYSGGGTADIYYRVTDGTNTLAGYTSTSTSFKITTAASSWTDSLDLAFPCPSSGGLRLELESAGNAAALSIDDIYIGENFRVGTVAQAEFVGGMEQTAAAGCNYGQNTSSGLSNYVALGSGSGCNAWSTTGSISATGTNSHTAIMSSPKPGTYIVQIAGLFQSTAPNSCMFRLSDGTNTYQPQGITHTGTTTMGFNTLTFHVTYTAGQSNTTFTIQSSDDHAGTCKLENTVSGLNVSWKFYRFPLASDTVVSAGVPYQGGTLSYPTTANCSWDNTSSSYANFAADTDCGTQTVTGNVQATATKIPGFAVASLEAGTYLVLVQGTAAGPATQNHSIRITDGTNTSGYNGYFVNGTGADFGLSLAGVFRYTSKQTNLTFQLQGATTGGTNSVVANNTNKTLQFTLIPLSPSITMPNLVGSVTSNTTGSERIERVYVTNSGTPTISKQSGSWVTSLTDVGPGETKINIASGIFSDTPSCTVTCHYTGSCFSRILSSDTYSNSIMTIRTENFSGSLTDMNFTVICQGPR